MKDKHSAKDSGDLSVIDGLCTKRDDWYKEVYRPMTLFRIAALYSVMFVSRGFRISSHMFAAAALRADEIELKGQPS